MPPPATSTPRRVQDASGRTPDEATSPAQVRLAPFTRGAMKHREPFLDSSAVVSANGTTVNAQDVPSFGYLRGLWFLVNSTGGTGTAAVYKEDAPWSAMSNIVLSDVSGTQLVGPIDGYDLFLINLFGGYQQRDPRTSGVYVAPTTAGNFAFMLWLPLEISERDGLGSIPNQNASSTYKLSFSHGITTNVFSTNPTGLPTVRVRAWLDAWSQPTPADVMGNPQADVPPAFGTTSFWTRNQVNVSAGEQTVRLPRVGNLIRAVLFVFRVTAGTRSTANFPDPARIQMEGRIIENLGRDLWQWIGYQQSNMTLTADDATDPFPAGVLPWLLNTDLDGGAGNEMRDLWLPTSGATRLELVGSFGGAGTLTILTNDVTPTGDYHIS